MKQYYYADNDQQFGPFTIEELKSKRLKKSFLVWTDGMADWTSADNIDELKDILIAEPPPLPKNSASELINEPDKIKPGITDASLKYDLDYKKADDATFLGIILFVIPIVLKLSGAVSFYPDDSEIRDSIVICLLIIRIVATSWVINIAKRQNRNSTSWGWFAFIFPSIALIVIGQLKKLHLKIELNENLTREQQVAILLEKANQLFSDNRYPECIEILNKAIEIESNLNFECIKLRGLVYYEIENYEEAKTDFETLINNEKFPSIANYYLGNLAIIIKDRELAIKYWIKADELKNENAKIKLDLFYTYTGDYLLDKSQIAKKLTENYTLYFGNGKYKGGIAEVDNVENLSNLKTKLMGYENGLKIELVKILKVYNICIAYYEIDNIVFKETENLFEIHLADKNVLTFSYIQSEDVNNGLKNLCKCFKQATGKTPDASISWI